MIDKIPQELASEGVVAGVEVEIVNKEKHNPFDPDSISLSSKTVALDAVLRRIKNSTIRLAPDFQRNYVWDIERKSLLIESMMLRIPLPMFYVSEGKDGVWEVVDGLQRLTTIRDFILGPDEDGKGFSLKGLEFWGELFNGENFYKIEKKLGNARVVNNLMEAELSFTIINPDTPENVKRNIFKRINTGGMRLSEQEIRNALYQGEATVLLKELTLLKEYIAFIENNVNDSRMAGRELLLRYIAFFLIGKENFKGTMDEFMSNTMRWINGEIDLPCSVPYCKNNLIDRFKIAIKRSDIIFGNHAFRRSFDRKKKTPINKPLFEIWMVCFSKMTTREFNLLLKNMNEFEKAYHQLLEKDNKFTDAIGRYGSESIGVKDRYEKIGILLEEFVND